MKKLIALPVLLGAALVSAVANAAIDVSAVTTTLNTDGVAAVTAVAAAAIGVVVVMKVFKMIRGAM